MKSAILNLQIHAPCGLNGPNGHVAAQHVEKAKGRGVGNVPCPLFATADIFAMEDQIMRKKHAILEIVKLGHPGQLGQLGVNGQNVPNRVVEG